MVGLFLFPQRERYKSTLLNYLSNIVLYIVGIAEVHSQITKTTRRKAVKYYAVARSSLKKIEEFLSIITYVEVVTDHIIM